MPLPPASGDLNSHIELSARRSPRRSVIALRPRYIPSVKFVGLPVPRIWMIFGHGIKRPDDLDLWPVNEVTGHPCHWLLPIFSFPCPSVLDFGSSKGQTDRQTDRQRSWCQCIMPPWVEEINISTCCISFCFRYLILFIYALQ